MRTGRNLRHTLPPRAWMGERADLRVVLVAVGVGLVAVAVRLPQVFARAFWQDEVASARILSEPTLFAMLRQVRATESTPPFWYALGWGVHRLGVPLREVRLLLVLFGALGCVLVVLVARRSVSLVAAAAAGLMCALGAELVRRGWEVRSYELLLLLSLLLGFVLLAELEQRRGPWSVLLAAAVAVGGLTHLFFVLTVLAALLWLWLDPAPAPIRLRATRAMIVGAVAPLAWAPVMLTHYQPGRWRWIGPFHARQVLAVALRLFSYAYSRPLLGPTLSALGLLVVVAGGLLLARRSPAGRLLMFLSLLPIASAAVVWLAGMPIFDRRNLIGTAPPLPLRARSTRCPVERSCLQLD